MLFRSTHARTRTYTHTHKEEEEEEEEGDEEEEEGEEITWGGCRWVANGHASHESKVSNMTMSTIS